MLTDVSSRAERAKARQERTKTTLFCMSHTLLVSSKFFVEYPFRQKAQRAVFALSFP